MVSEEDVRGGVGKMSGVMQAYYMEKTKKTAAVAKERKRSKVDEIAANALAEKLEEMKQAVEQEKRAKAQILRNEAESKREVERLKRERKEFEEYKRQQREELEAMKESEMKKIRKEKKMMERSAKTLAS